jgi:hypothetical protein
LPNYKNIWRFFQHGNQALAHNRVIVYNQNTNGIGLAHDSFS